MVLYGATICPANIFEVEAAGTTGAGDCTLAGLLAGLSQEASPEEALTIATAVGACSVEKADSTSGVPCIEDVRRRIASGWARRDRARPPVGWDWNGDYAIWHGPSDRR